MRLHLLISCITLLPLGVGAATACGPNSTWALKHLDFNVTESGKSIPVEKFYMDDGITDSSPQNLAFTAAKQGDIPGAIKILTDDTQARPTNSWNHYDLGVLYEATLAWDKAEAEMKEAQRIDAAEKPPHPPEKRFADELVYIAAHKGK
jgi:hypothetical protein